MKRLALAILLATLTAAGCSKPLELKTSGGAGQVKPTQTASDGGLEEWETAIVFDASTCVLSEHDYGQFLNYGPGILIRNGENDTQQSIDAEWNVLLAAQNHLRYLYTHHAYKVKWPQRCKSPSAN